MDKVIMDDNLLLPVKEVRALLKYAAESAIVIPPEIMTPLHNYIDRSGEHDSIHETPQDVIEAYTFLCLLTKPIIGQTLIDSCKYRSRGTRSPIRWVCTIFLFFALLNLILEIHYSTTDTEFDWLKVIQEYVLSPLAPFFWGGLGKLRISPAISFLNQPLHSPSNF